MSIAGALMGFAVASIIVGVIGAVVTAVSWIDADEWSDMTKRKKYLIFFVVLFFIGSIFKSPESTCRYASAISPPASTH